MKNLFLFCLFVTGLYASDAAPRKILFLGNSYTYVNDLPGTLKNLALSLGDSIDVDSYCPGGSSLQSLFGDPNTLAKIQLPGWDYVVIQAQSQEPSFSPGQVQANTYPYAKKLDSLVHIYNPCAESIFYMTWGRKNGDAGNCAVYPPVCTYEGMQQRLRESYLEMSDDNDASCAPVGAVWRLHRLQYPTVELYQPDESHPSVHGTYLAACTFYSSLFHKSSSGATYTPAGITAAEALNIRSLSASVVLDSLENWQQQGSLPFAAFTYTNNLNQYTFTNNSMRSTSYAWDFGDGSPIDNSTNPVHTYAASGNFPVKLTASNNCKSEVVQKTVNVGGVPNNIQDPTAIDPVLLQYNNGSLFFSRGCKEFGLYDLNGRLILSRTNIPGNSTLVTGSLPGGVYLFKLTQPGNKITNGKVIVR